MAVFYKNQGYKLSTTSLTTVLSINTSSVAIIKEISVANTHNNTVPVNYYFNDYSASVSYIFFHVKVPADSQYNAVANALVLEQGDYLQFQADTSNVISGQISYALLNRDGTNG
jgi:hypothetical protein